MRNLFRIIPFLMLVTLFVSGCENANANSGSEKPSCEGGVCEEHACHCEMKMSAPQYFSGEKCSDEYPVMQGHTPVKLPNGQIVRGVMCRKIEHKCGCDHAE